MATLVLSECGLRPFPRLYPKLRTGLPDSSFSNPNFGSIGISPFKTSKTIAISSYSRMCRDKNWALKVSALVTIPFLDEDKSEITGEFNPDAPPPIGINCDNGSSQDHACTRSRLLPDLIEFPIIPGVS
ncbi:hypothetical protein L2E82_10932 [Cichorium intybus]|uniref:Uncharacterized protein n=1 Tax=Cichorium intybus TaxID=13427 RepID=A0ACB9GBS7_CICIN|nr:hypothetical protein L2E82_10932 [Cichorium intybus]